jgi:hypothetical protein
VLLEVAVLHDTTQTQHQLTLDLVVQEVVLLDSMQIMV